MSLKKVTDELGLKLLRMRVALIWGEDFCTRRVCYKSEEEALNAIASRKDEDNDVVAFPCPFCDGEYMELPDGTKSTSLKNHGWHIGPNTPVTELEVIAEMTVKECLKHGYPISNDRLKYHIDNCDTENIFLHHGYADVADPKIRQAYEVAEKAYYHLCSLLGCE